MIVYYLKIMYLLEFCYLQITFTTFLGDYFTNSEKLINRSKIFPKTVIGGPCLFAFPLSELKRPYYLCRSKQIQEKLFYVFGGRTFGCKTF